MATSNHLSRWQYRALLGTVIALAFSGLIWLIVHYGWGAGADQLPHPAEVWLIRVHGAAGFASLFMAGLLATQHIPHGWRLTTLNLRNRQHKASQRRTGLTLCSLGACAILSAYLLYYFAPENMRPALGWAHAALGMGLAMLLPFHHHRHQRRAEPVHPGAKE